MLWKSCWKVTAASTRDFSGCGRMQSRTALVPPSPAVGCLMHVLCRDGIPDGVPKTLQRKAHRSWRHWQRAGRALQGNLQGSLSPRPSAHHLPVRPEPPTRGSGAPSALCSWWPFPPASSPGPSQIRWPPLSPSLGCDAGTLICHLSLTANFSRVEAQSLSFLGYEGCHWILKRKEERRCPKDSPYEPAPYKAKSERSCDWQQHG